MALQKPAITGDGFALRLAVFYAGLFIALGIQMPFLPVWLAAKGLDANAIGTVLAAPLVVRIFTVPFVAGVADRSGALRGTLMAATVTATAGFAALGLANGFWPILLLLAFASASFTSIFPLADTYALKGLAARGRSYGSVRLWGSGAFIVGSLGAGSLFEVLRPENLIWVMTAAALAMMVLSTALQPIAGTTRPHAPGASAAFLRSPGFLAIAAAASLIQASHALYYGFSTLDWSAAGLDGHAIGVLWAIGVVAEIVLFAVSGRLPAALTPGIMLGIGAAGAVVRWAAMALGPPALLLPFLQCLHGLSFGATHLGAVQFLAHAAPDRLGATAQGALTIAVGGTMALFMGLSGWLYGAYGAHAYGAMALAALAGGLLALPAHRLWVSRIATGEGAGAE